MNANAIEQAIGSFEGWDGFDRLEAEGQASQDAVAFRQQQRVALFQRVFGTAEGQQVLAELKAGTLERPVVPPSVPAGQAVTLEQIVAHTVFRAGQNSVVAEIVRLVEGNDVREMAEPAVQR